MPYKKPMTQKAFSLLLCLMLIAFSTSARASPNNTTSTDIYCESMTLSLYESMLNYEAPKTPELEKRVEKAQSETLKGCKAMPTVGAAEKNIKNMTPEEISLISCVGMAEGIFMAQTDSTSNQFSYVELTKNRKFIASACTTNKKRFLGDLRKYGPKHVLGKNYQ